jgi:6-phosphofructokinase 1
MRAKYNVIIGQSGGPTATMNAVLSGVTRGCRANPQVEHVLGMKFGLEGLISNQVIAIPKSFPAQQPGAWLGSCRFKLSEAELAITLNALQLNNIREFYYIGGNDSMLTCHALHKYAEQHNFPVKIIGIPATIDNDIPHTNRATGYGSAAKYIATTTQNICYDVQSYNHPSVTIIEIMGRDSGWLTAASTLAPITPDLVYVPERKFNDTVFLEDIERAFKTSKTLVIAVAEGLRYEDNSYVCTKHKQIAADAFDNVCLSGLARQLRDTISWHLNCKTRAIELNLPQRCAAHVASLTDFMDAEQLGYFAAQCPDGGRMVGFHNRTPTQFCSTPLSDVINRGNLLPNSFIGHFNTITEDFHKWATPLIAGELRLSYKDGVPHYN